MKQQKDQQKPNPWKTLSSKVMYQNPWMLVREDKVITPGGSEGTYTVIESKPGVHIIAEADDKKIFLIKSFRYPTQRWTHEIPGGGIEPGDTPLQAAKKELEDELGYLVKKWTQLGSTQPSNNGLMIDKDTVFLAQGLRPVATHHEAAEAIEKLEPVPIAKVFDMVRAGDVNDGQTLSALLHYKLWLEHGQGTGISR